MHPLGQWTLWILIGLKMAAGWLPDQRPVLPLSLQSASGSRRVLKLVHAGLEQKSEAATTTCAVWSFFSEILWKLYRATLLKAIGVRREWRVYCSPPLSQISVVSDILLPGLCNHGSNWCMVLDVLKPQEKSLKQMTKPLSTWYSL